MGDSEMRHPDHIHHHTDGQSIEELAKKYPGSVESHIMLHRKLDAIADKLIELIRIENERDEEPPRHLPTR